MMDKDEFEDDLGATPDVDEVYQRDPDDVVTVPVRLDGGPLPVHDMPSQLGACRNVVLKAAGNAPAVKILNADPRRKKAIIWAIALAGGAEGVCIAGTREEAEMFTGAILHIGTGLLRYEFENTSELFARPVLVGDAAGIFTGFSAATVDVLMSIVVEQWSR
jgi:hypothetical protein